MMKCEVRSLKGERMDANLSSNITPQTSNISPAIKKNFEVLLT